MALKSSVGVDRAELLMEPEQICGRHMYPKRLKE
jgi:hypothetical protein